MALAAKSGHGVKAKIVVSGGVSLDIIGDIPLLVWR